MAYGLGIYIMKYYVKLINQTEPNVNEVCYLTFRNKTTWCRKIAKKHAEEFIKNFPDYTYKLELE